MRYFLILLTTCLFSPFINAQSAEDSVKTTVNNLFTAMRNADPVLLRSVFADSAVLQTISVNREQRVIILNEDVDDFVEFVKEVKKDSADERIRFETIKIDGPLAIVWTPYNFYYAGKFSHCGVDSFQLVKLNGVWKIQYLIDTRRRQGCQ